MPRKRKPFTAAPKPKTPPQRPRGYKAEKRDGEVALALIEHDGDRAKAAEALGITQNALTKRLLKSKAILEQVERVRDEVARQASALAGKQALTKAELLVLLSNTARGNGESWYQTAGKDGEIITLKRGPTFTERTGAGRVVAEMNPEWLAAQRMRVEHRHYAALDAMSDEELIRVVGGHGSRAVEHLAAIEIDCEREDAPAHGTDRKPVDPDR